MIYILEFERPLGSDNPRGKARYYVGFCEDDRLNKRFEEHCRGEGAAITRACVERGIRFWVVLTLSGDREEEKRIQRYKNTPKFVSRMKGKA